MGRRAKMSTVERTTLNPVATRKRPATRERKKGKVPRERTKEKLRGRMGVMAREKEAARRTETMRSRTVAARREAKVRTRERESRRMRARGRAAMIGAMTRMTTE